MEGRGRFCRNKIATHKMKITLTPKQSARFLARVEKTDECHIWTGCLAANGYGMVRINNVTLYAHRVAWALKHGGPPDELDVCHTCDNRRCVNSLHLFLGTRADNMRDCIAKGRSTKGKLSAKRIRGERHPMSKLTDDFVREIRRLFAAGGITRTQLAATFGVRQPTISKVISGGTWRHVQPSP